MFHMFLSDPVVWGSMLGLGLVVAICAYYVYLFLSHSQDQTN